MIRVGNGKITGKGYGNKCVSTYNKKYCCSKKVIIRDSSKPSRKHSRKPSIKPSKKPSKKPSRRGGVPNVRYVRVNKA